jgi:carboxyl-terminal processing protease
MTRRPRLLHAVCLAAALAAAACARAPAPAAAPAQPAAPRAVSQELALLTFDSAWSRIAHTHYDTAFAGVDWHGVRAELRPRAAAVRTLDQLRGVIADMLARLGESHFALIPAEAADALGSADDAARHISGDAGLAVRLVDDQLLVWRLEPDAPAATAGVRMGWTLDAIDGRALAPRLDALLAMPEAERRIARTRLLMQVNAELAGDVGESRTLRLRDEAGRSLQRTLVLQPSPGEMVRFGNLPPLLATLSHAELDSGDGCVGVIRMNVWMVPLMAGFDRAIDALRHCQGMVLDLRGNPGGVAGMVSGVAGHFMTDTAALGIMRTRTTELRFRANPRRVSVAGQPVEPYAAPLAILIDEVSVSTSEVFAAGLQGVGRARVFGSQSAGQALPAVMIRLPTGDVLMHAIADFTAPDGSRIEGDGVMPDVAAPPTRRDLLAGRDAALDAAVNWIQETMHSPQGERP